jgi:preprotein translocase subunit SecD
VAALQASGAGGATITGSPTLPYVAPYVHLSAQGSTGQLLEFVKAPNGARGGVLHVRLQARHCAVTSPAAMAAARTIITRRILALGVRRARVTEVGQCSIDVVASGVKDQRQFIATIGAPGRLVLYGMGALPVLKEGATFPYSVATAPASFCAVPKPPSPCIVIIGADLDLSKISVGYDTFGAPVVNAGTKGTGVDRFSAYTGAHIGQHMAIVLDGTVITDPTIQAQLSTDWQITGIGSIDEATTIATSLKYGALPIAFTIAFVNQ